MVTVEAGSRPASPYEVQIDPKTGEPFIPVLARGAALKDDAFLNKGTCFSVEERNELGLRGILPPAVSSEAEQEERSYQNYLRAGDDVAKYLFLASLQDRNETLFYRLVLHHLEEMIPIIYTPTVGKVCERYSHIYRRPRGVYISTEDRGRIAEVLLNAKLHHPDVIVATDNEAILGIGDQGVGGMGIAIGKLALYTAGAGIHPAHTLPLDIDVGTDNEALLADPLYLGVRHRRLRGDEYISLLDELVEAIGNVFPGVLVQWEDFANQRAFQVLRRYRRSLPSFDDDIQGTGAVVESGVRTAIERIGQRLEDQRVVFFGAGASGAGCAMQLRVALHEAGVPAAELGRRVLCVDSRGLILTDRPNLDEHKRDVAADPSVAAGWTSERAGRFGLMDVVTQFKPTVLIGVSGQSGAFTEDVIKAMHRSCERPVVLALSNPTDKVEAKPVDILRWTNGAAIVGTGSPFPPVELNGVTHHIGQGNNVLVFPGIGLGATVVRARWLPDVTFSAAARAVHGFANVAGGAGAPIFPSLANLREISQAVAVAVGRALVDAGAAPELTPREIEERVAAAMWQPKYVKYRPA